MQSAIVKSCSCKTSIFKAQPTQANARHVSALHEVIHGFPGMLRSLDCIHFPQNNCPIAFQGQFINNKKGYPIIILEAIADFNLCFWHTTFGIPGSLNGINVWDTSKLHKALVDRMFSTIDFKFEIVGKLFNKLWFLVDGIYLQLASSLQTLSAPLGECGIGMPSGKKLQGKIKLAFGIFQSKFSVICHPIKKWQLKTIQGGHSED